MLFINDDFEDQNVWRSIEEFPGYMVSRYGEVASFRKGDPILLKPYINGQGYKQVTLCRNGFERMRTVHRLVADAFLTNRSPEHCCVCHKDDNPSNNFVENLKWGTAKDNHIDAIRNGRLVYKRVYCLQARTLYKTAKEAAEALCVSREAVSRSCSSGGPGPYNLYFCYEEDMAERLKDIKKWTKHSGIGIKPYYNLRADAVYDLAEKGHCNEEIAKELGLRESTVRAWILRRKRDGENFKPVHARKQGALLYIMNIDTGESTRYDEYKKARESVALNVAEDTLVNPQKNPARYVFWYDNTEIE